MVVMTLTNDQALADKVVALGVGSRKDTAYYRGINYEVLTADLFVRDPRVAMALMQKAWPDICLYWHEFYEAVNRRLNGKSISELPRAITEACVEALTDE